MEKEKSVLESMFGGGEKSQKESESWFMERLSGLAPWLVKTHKKDKKRVFSFDKRNSIVVGVIVGLLLLGAIIFDQSGDHQEVQKANSGIPELNLALPSVNPNEIRSGAMPGGL